MQGPLKCPKCSHEMEEGFFLDQPVHRLEGPGHWIAGKPERSSWSGTKTDGRMKFQIHAFRCKQCGFLESYAADITNET